MNDDKRDELERKIVALQSQLAEATGLLRRCRDAIKRDPAQIPLDKEVREFLSRAPAQATETGPDYACADMQGPVVADRQAAVMWMKRAESAESKLAAVRALMTKAAPYDSASEYRDEAYFAVSALLAPSQGEEGGGND